MSNVECRHLVHFIGQQMIFALLAQLGKVCQTHPGFDTLDLEKKKNNCLTKK
jgi:hypothetical protein